METIENCEIDHLFAAQTAPGAPDHVRLFLRRLMAHSRKGHLCLKSPEPIRADQIAEGSNPIPTAPVIHENGRYYLQRNWVLETTILNHIQRLLSARPALRVDTSSLALPPQLNERQADVVRHALGHSLTIVTGGPGTGKTFTAGHVIKILAQLRPAAACLRVKIAAPTGKAADRLAQTVGAMDQLEIESLTLHRLLSLQPGRNRLFEKRSILADLIVVDEASMIDASLFAHLLAAVSMGSRLILLGDADQLPPINGGGVFADLAEGIAIHLDQCHRTKEENIQNIYEAARIGDVNALYTILEPLPNNIIEWAEPMLGPLIFDGRPSIPELFDRFDRLRLISPLRKGQFGVDAINAAILRRQQQKLSFDQWWAAPIILTNNDSSLQLYNGSPGIVVGRYRGGTIPYGNEETILGDGRVFLLNQLPGYEFAFALSIHKSQGSEYEEVVCCLPHGSEEFAREALYTAVTRAKRLVRLAGDRDVLDSMLGARSRQENGLLERMAALGSFRAT
jgi:exodeoxyribonuclease V alpha subunit